MFIRSNILHSSDTPFTTHHASLILTALMLMCWELPFDRVAFGDSGILLRDHLTILILLSRYRVSDVPAAVVFTVYTSVAAYWLLLWNLTGMISCGRSACANV